MRRSLAMIAAMAFFAAAPAHAQHMDDHGDHSQADQMGMATSQGLPDGWMMRFDRSNAGPDMLDFEEMQPGWHVTSGGAGAAIYWQPGMEANGSFTLTTTMDLLKPAPHPEAFGLFVGGQDLGGADQQYLYFLVRQTGEFLIKRRNGMDTEDVVGWTANDAIPSMAAGASSPVRYRLAIAVNGGQVRFMVNGTAVHTMPASQLHVTGQAGMRINHMLDVHVEDLDLTKRM